MKPSLHLAIVGSGATAIYLLKHLCDRVDALQLRVKRISIFEKSGVMGMGMPYNPQTTDRYNLSNISSVEIPELVVPFIDWLRAQDRDRRQELNVPEQELSEHEVYSRVALGSYLQAQYQQLLERLVTAGIQVEEYPHCEITDIAYLEAQRQVELTICERERHPADVVFIAAGHRWDDDDGPSTYFPSPWPIFKLLPPEESFYAFPVGTLGASLSAFDVVSSLAHRHGSFRWEKGRLNYHPHPGTEAFRLVMHAAEGWLPQLQYEQAEPIREIYRHVDRADMLALRDERGLLRLDTFFDQVCRPALREAFRRDGIAEMVTALGDPTFTLHDFIERMADKRDYADAFEGMQQELLSAQRLASRARPTHWKEVLDDLIYCLNYHAELLPAEDHHFFRKQLMPFLMNVIAAMPFPSARILVALHEAGKLDLVPGYVEVHDEQPHADRTVITITHEEKAEERSYRLFVNCGGQRPVEVENYPFPTLIAQGAVRAARAPLAHPERPAGWLPEGEADRLMYENGEAYYLIGGIDIDAAYRIIGKDGQPNNHIYDISFPHTSGIRPYSYGLQACSATSLILVTSWLQHLNDPSDSRTTIEEITGLYRANEEL